MAELEVLGYTHAEAGAFLLSMWGVPNSVFEGVAWHNHASECIRLELSTVVARHFASNYAQERNPYWMADGMPPDVAYLGKIGCVGREQGWRCILQDAPPTRWLA
jgi:HDOD domain